ncbi:MAG: alpha/beta hydrolase, partial [Ruthenibacterium sp.]
MKAKLHSAKFWVCIALTLCLISMIGASLIQTSGNKITIKEMSWESPSGHQLSAYLFKPPTASKDAPAPAVVTIEGWYNNKEMQDLYSIELARRGYVVLALDMHSHGNSESLAAAELYDGAVGVDGAVQLVADLPYVDATRIGVTGHSSGGTAANMAVAIDNEREVPLIKSVLQQAGDWQDDTGADHSGDYGSRSVGIIASEYDDFYFGTYDDAGKMLTNPKQFMETDGAKKFLNFNEDGFAGTAEGGKYYEKSIDGVDSYRVIYRPTMIHPMVPFSMKCVGYAVDFFETSLGAPRALPASNQIWVWKTVFNAIGLVGLLIFMYSFALAMLATPTFACLKAEKDIEPEVVTDKGAKLWFWIMMVVGAIFSGASYVFCMNTVYSKTTPFFVQTGPLTIGTWAAICGVFAIVMMLLYYFTYGKKHGWTAKKAGLTLNFEQLWKTLLLAAIVIVVSFGLVFFAGYFFKTDFRLYVLAVKTFAADKVIIALKYLPFFLLFYVANSVSINCFNYSTLGGKKGGNIFLLALFNALGAIFIVASQYIYFYSTSYQLYGLTEGQRMMPIWLFSVMFILFGAAIVSRIIYKKTGNPYLAGLINAMFVTMISCSNTTTILGG